MRKQFYQFVGGDSCTPQSVHDAHKPAFLRQFDFSKGDWVTCRISPSGTQGRMVCMV